MIKKILAYNLALLVVVTSLFGLASAQSKYDIKVATKEVEKNHFASLQSHFEDYELVHIDSRSWAEQLEKAEYSVTSKISLGSSGNMDMVLTKSNLRSATCILPTQNTERNYKGYIAMNQGGEVRISVAPNFIYGWYDIGGQKYFIEPLRNYIASWDEKADIYVLYKEGAHKVTGTHKCGVEIVKSWTEKVVKPYQGMYKVECKEIELATACDVAYKNYWGGATEASLQMEAVVNAMNPAFLSTFTFDFQFTIIEEYIPDTDPWTSSTDMCLLLDEFRQWGEGGGLASNFDVAQLWTTRNLAIPTGAPNCPGTGFTPGAGYVGFSYTPMICSQYSYLVMEQYTSSLSSLKILNAHELGHSMGALTHTSDGIMTTTILPTTNFGFEALSVNEINDFIDNGYTPNFIPPPSCFDTSCPVAPCLASAGTLSTTGELEIDINGATTFTVQGQNAVVYDYIISDVLTSQVVYFGPNPLVSGALLGVGEYCIQGLSHDGTISYNIGDPAPNPSGESGDCFAISPCSAGTTVTIIEPAVPKVRLNVLLEGFYSGNGLMSNGLMSLQLIPYAQPYNTAPHYYAGNETVTDFPVGVLDWIYVQARSSSNDMEVLDEAVGFVNSQGDVVDINGQEGVSFPNLSPGNYNIAVFHRNHLAVMTAEPISLPNDVSYSFSGSMNSAKGVDKLKYEDGYYVLFAGDYNMDGNINSTDYNAWAGDAALVNEYVGFDGNGSGVVNSGDYNIWFTNRSKLAYNSLIY